MEKLYRFLKILIIVLLAAVILAAAILLVGRFTGSSEEPTVPPDPAPDFTMYDIDGNACKLSDFQGKPVILNFWASWCAPCKMEMPFLETAFQTYGQDIQFLIVNLTDGGNETVETASGYIAEQGFTFPVYYDTELEGAMAYSIFAIPMTYFIDSDGNIRAIQEGIISEEILLGNIQALLAQ